MGRVNFNIRRYEKRRVNRVRVINEFGGEAVALILFVVQLGLNAPWSYLFFGLHRPDMAFYDIIAL